jgi:glucosamine--fructose-6-phosphate aminotransferase (isomerizing)
LLISLAAGNDALKKDLVKAAALSANVVRLSDQVSKNLTTIKRFNKYIYLGMRPYCGLLQEGSLKTKEMSCVWTESYGTLEFRHGPMSIVDAGMLIVLLVSEQARRRKGL